MIKIRYHQYNGKLRTIHVGEKGFYKALELLKALNLKVVTIN